MFHVPVMPYNLMGISIGMWGSICYSYVKYVQQMHTQTTTEAAKERIVDEKTIEKEKGTEGEDSGSESLGEKWSNTKQKKKDKEKSEEKDAQEAVVVVIKEEKAI